MADPISIGASIVAFIQVADRLIRVSRHCIEAVRDAPSDIRMIFCEVSSIKVIIESLNSPEWRKEGTTSFVARLFAKSGPVDSCQRCLCALEALLPAELAQETPPTKRYIVPAAQLAWPFKQSKVRKLLAELSYQKATLLLAISGDIT